MSENATYFHNKLITWYLDNKRDLPWRHTTDPYRIWLSEIILQQTRVAQGLPYYQKFVEAYPTVQTLASATEESVLKLWQGLGYYSRARNMLIASKFVANELNGVFPDNYTDLKKLKGVGDYTASAIASICYGEPAAVVDGNVYRVLSRVFGIDTPINSSEGIKEFKSLAQVLIDSKRPGAYNQAVMEFGARHCTPKNPACSTCIFKLKCEALRTNRVSELPVKLKKSKVRKRYFNYIVVQSEDGRTLLQQRHGKGIWQHLYEFPLVETQGIVSDNELQQSRSYETIVSQLTNDSETMLSSAVVQYNDVPIQHKLSHQHLYTTFWILKTDSLGKKGILFEKVKDFPVSVLISNFLDSFQWATLENNRQ